MSPVSIFDVNSIAPKKLDFENRFLGHKGCMRIHICIYIYIPALFTLLWDCTLQQPRCRQNLRDFTFQRVSTISSQSRILPLRPQLRLKVDELRRFPARRGLKRRHTSWVPVSVLRYYLCCIEFAWREMCFCGKDTTLRDAPRSLHGKYGISCFYFGFV